ncbi:MAG: respiratory nitrate reductase subunit gamma [Candidatus Omnitrophica bacterium]|nr:respiratory nitrate reductase subunit gamma [Candidatus Omnitrophota bacterium]MDE2009855.1 respiratory nitrate reductase subunit gamma [Candidatus Omnitrophota bacterium]MDE2214363.1 respiratory nitrate reductase subunit gamma [Candidatus Omnitrophota bacterium]MDE2231112.1 respiratory nitrate reductase subunit gamma [Candidatus Omnitrophota bacterium]
MNVSTLLLWLVLPYIVLTFFIVATLFRFKTDPYGWTSKSSEILEKRLLKWGNPLFHWGLMFVFFGHVAGLLVPIGFYHALGVNDEFYHFNAVVVGGAAGLATLVGLMILCYRRFKLPRVRKTSSIGDFIALVFLVVMVISGIFATASNAAAHAGFDYRMSINPWIRGILLLHPDPELMVSVPWYFKVHILAAYGLFVAFPFTRLVHVFSLPITYLWRSYVLYRKYSVNVPGNT